MITLRDLASAATTNDRSRQELETKASFRPAAKKKKKKEKESIAVPEDKVVTARAARKEGYEEVKADLEEWVPYVRSEARSEYLRFGDRRRIKDVVVPENDVGEAAKTRSVLYDAEQKQKYHKKNAKSKAYAKHRRKKQRERTVADKEAAAKDDPALQQQLEDEAAKKRIHERTSLRHASSSAWAKAVKKRGRAAIDGTSSARHQAHQLSQDLKQKPPVEEEEEPEEAEAEAPTKKKSRLESMAFLQRALGEQARARERAMNDVHELKDELLQDSDDDPDLDDKRPDPIDDDDDDDKEKEQVPFEGALEPGSLQLKKKKKKSSSSNDDDAWLKAIDVTKPTLTQATTKADGGPKRLRDLTQEELVDLAFDAGDAEEFAKEKVEAETMEVPEEEDKKMPGWGSWTGEGIEEVKKPMMPKPKLNLPPGHPGRSPHVIINPKRIKKQAHLKVAQLPYPFTSKAQYEAYMAQPLGKEWNVDKAVHILTRPDVVSKPGVAIAPIRKVARPSRN